MAVVSKASITIEYFDDGKMEATVSGDGEACRIANQIMDYAVKAQADNFVGKEEFMVS